MCKVCCHDYYYFFFYFLSKNNSSTIIIDLWNSLNLNKNKFTKSIIVEEWTLIYVTFHK